MNKFLMSLAICTAMVACVTGCGGSGAPTNVGESATADAMAAYEAEQKASEAAMSNSMNESPAPK